MTSDAGALPRCEVKTPMTPDHTAFQCTDLGRVESEMVGLPAMALIREATRRLRLFVHAAGGLHRLWVNS